MSSRGRVKRQLTEELILDPQARVRNLSDIGSSVAVNKVVPVKRYFRSGSEMERQARVYYTEGQFDKAFVLYNKFATLFLEKLPKTHPDYAAPQFKADRAKIKKLLKEAFPRAEELKKKLIVRFEAEKEAFEKKLAAEAEVKAAEELRAAEEARRRAEREREGRERERQAREREEEEQRQREKTEELASFLSGSAGLGDKGESEYQSGIGRDRHLTGDATSSTSYDSSKQEPTSLADHLTNTQTSYGGEGGGGGGRGGGGGEGVAAVTARLAAVEITAPGTGPSLDPGERSVTATNPALAQVLPPLYEGFPAPASSEAPATSRDVPPTTGMAPLTQLLGAGLLSPAGDAQVQGSMRTYQSIFSAPTSLTQTPQTPPSNYPPPVNPYYSSAGGQGSQYGGYTPPAMAAQGYTVQPYSPPGQYTSQSSTASSWGSVELPPPTYHMTSLTGTYQIPAVVEEEEEERTGPPDVDRSNKPSYSGLSTSIGGGYRRVFIPENVSHRFEEIASLNTRQNIETCGILAGTLSRNELHLTHIIVPKQRGGPDSCETLNEEELFDVQDQHDLITLGWIHTHPSQTAFMSSVDLHTHCSYQIMLDEAVAIVCAPKYRQVGVFNLTEPYGLDYITHCEEGGFHTHPKVPPLYEECKHVVFSPQSSVNVVDLR